jgi:uncharacterized RmlC-like cupin family protein
MGRTTVLPTEAVPTQSLAIGIVSTRPSHRAGVHHHGEMDTTGYVVKGTMRFHSGPGLRQYVDVNAGEYLFIEPYAVHAEENPDPASASRAIVVRDTLGPSMFPCEVPETTRDGGTGVTAIAPAPEGSALLAGEGRFSAIAAHRLETRRMALDRLVLPPGGAFEAPEPAWGETAVTVLRGRGQIAGHDTPEGLECAADDWVYVEAGTCWSARNLATDAPAELLVARCAPA